MYAEINVVVTSLGLYLGGPPLHTWEQETACGPREMQSIRDYSERDMYFHRMSAQYTASVLAKYQLSL